MRRSKRWAELEQLIRDEQGRGRCFAARDRNEVQLLRRHVAQSVVVEPFPRLFATNDYWNALRPDARHLHIVRALAARDQDIVFCSHSAALIHGLPVSYHLLDAVHCVTKASAPSKSRGMLKRHGMTPHEITCVDGLRAISLVEAAVDSMVSAPFADALAVADGLLRTFDIDRDVLKFIVEELSGSKHGAAIARRAAAFADGRAESGGESIARAVMIEAGMPPSDIQPALSDPVEPWREVRPDFLFLLKDGSTALGELDGLDKYDDPELTQGRSTTEVLARERRRESHLTLLGMPVVRFSMHDVLTSGRLVYLLSVGGVTPSTLAPGDYRATGDGRPKK